ncbi:MAG: M16 family metallopeptidase [Bdellovibrionales bacterium]
MIKKYQLRNGLTVILIHSKKSPVVSVQMWVRTGSADEAKGEEGISHFIEHLVFKGTDKYKVGEIASKVEASGGELNAYTSFDQTVFHITLSKNYINSGLEMIRGMMGFPTFDAQEIDNEREVVIEEIKRSLDSPSREASRLMFSSSFKTHPYGIPVIGYPKTVSNVSRKKIVSYFQSRYVPSNMTLIVAGDFDENIKEKVSEHFSDFRPFKLKKVTRKKEKKQASPRIEVKKGPFEETFLNIAWKIPKPDHKDIPALEMMSLILGQGESSRLMQAARIRKPLANSIGSGAYTLKDGGIFIIATTLAKKNMEELLGALQTEIEKVWSEPPSAKEFEKALINFEAEEYYSLETVDGLARKYGHFEDLMRDPNYFPKFMKEIRKVKPLDVSRMAKKYLSPSQMTITCLGSEKEKGDAKKIDEKKLIAKWQKEYSKAWMKSKLSSKAKASAKMKKINWSFGSRSKGLPEKIKLSSGATLLLYPSYDTPAISLRAALPGGVRREPRELNGITELLGSTWTSGTHSRTEQEIQTLTEGMAAGLSAFGGRNSVGVSMDVLAPFQEKASELFGDVLANPRFSDEVIEREKIVMLENLKSRNDSPAQIGQQLFFENMFKNHPYAIDPSGTEESIAKIDAPSVLKLWSKWAIKENLIFSISGHFDRNLWTEHFEKATQSWRLKGEKWDLVPHEGPSENIKLFKKLEKEQTHIFTGYKGLTFTDDRRFTLQLLQSIFSGQGGRLFLELRDKESLAYTVAPIRMEGIDGGYFGAYIACSPEKADKALSMLQKEFDKVCNKLVSDEEVERSKNYIIGRHDIELQRNSSIAHSMLFDELYGLPFGSHTAFAKHIREISSRDIQKLAREIFSQSAVTIVVGKQAPSGF